MGHTLGHEDGIDVPRAFNKPNMRHNWETWMDMWSEIESKVDMQLDVKGSVDKNTGFGTQRGAKSWIDENWQRIVLEVETK